MDFVPFVPISMVCGLALFGFISLVIHNIYLATHNRKLSQELHLLKNSPEKRTKSIEAAQILHDMTVYGESLVRIIPINPADVFLRSPK